MSDLLWDFRVEAWREGNRWRVRLTGTQTGEVRERAGFHPLWELIRLISGKGKA